MHTIKYWVRCESNPTIKTFDNSQISEVFALLKILHDWGYNFTHSHISR